jgi:hypothetical protein
VDKGRSPGRMGADSKRQSLTVQSSAGPSSQPFYLIVSLSRKEKCRKKQRFLLIFGVPLSLPVDLERGIIASRSSRVGGMQSLMQHTVHIVTHIV